MDAHSYWSGIIIAETTYVIATLSPGPALLSTIGTSMGAGRRAGIALGLGIVAGSFCWAVMAALGVSLLIAANGRFLSIIALVGSVYLAFLGYKGFRSAIAMRSFIPSSTEVRRNLFGHFLRGWGSHLTNQRLFWLGWPSWHLVCDPVIQNGCLPPYWPALWPRESSCTRSVPWPFRQRE